MRSAPSPGLPTLRLPTLDAWNLSLQQSVTPTLAVTMAYVGNKGTHTLSAGDSNTTNPNEAGIVLPAQFSITGQQLHYDPNADATTTAGGFTGIAADGGTKNTTLLQRYYGGNKAACSDPLYATQAAEYATATGQPYPTCWVLPAGACGWTNGLSYYGDDQDTHFNALQVSVAKQFNHGYSPQCELRVAAWL